MKAHSLAADELNTIKANLKPWTVFMVNGKKKNYFLTLHITLQYIQIPVLCRYCIQYIIQAYIYTH